MTKRFKFSYTGKDYEVVGNYAGSSVDFGADKTEKNIFLITKVPVVETPMSADAPRPLIAEITADNKDDLLGKLKNKFPNFTDFISF